MFKRFFSSNNNVILNNNKILFNTKFLPFSYTKNFKLNLCFTGILSSVVPIIFIKEYFLIGIIYSSVIIKNIIKLYINRILISKMITKIEWDNKKVIFFSPYISMFGNLNLYGKSYEINPESIKIIDISFKNSLLININFEDLNNNLNEDFSLYIANNKTFLKNDNIFIELLKNNIDHNKIDDMKEVEEYINN